MSLLDFATRVLATMCVMGLLVLALWHLRDAYRNLEVSDAP